VCEVATADSPVPLRLAWQAAPSPKLPPSLRYGRTSRWASRQVVLLFAFKAELYLFNSLGMSLRVSFQKQSFQFNFEARTSRGAMKDRISWFIKIWNDKTPELFGLGECAPLPGLSRESLEDVEIALAKFESSVNGKELELPSVAFVTLSELESFLSLSGVECHYSSIRFAFETALLDLVNGGKRMIFKTKFIEGDPIPINGLIWMGGLDHMLQQIDIKIKDGFRCIKMKVGSHNFEKECDILQYIRRKYYRENIEVRVDANGAFKPEDALYKLKELAKFNVHSIEQPIKPGLSEMAELCRQSLVPIALDEELIGVESAEAKKELLARLKPSYIILKPSLHGGLFACQEWIQLAESQGIGWWITSALESSIGLNAIAQFTSKYSIQIPQGLGTGTIYTNNIGSPLVVENGTLTYNHQIDWDLTTLFPETEAGSE
jgi:o-succinylbenzoate synthase